MSAHIARYPQHVLLAALCCGIAAANAIRIGREAALLAVVAGVTSLGAPRVRFVLLAVGLALGGLWVGSVRLAAIDRSPLSAELGHIDRATVVVTGPARRSLFTLRLPARIERFGAQRIREPVLLELPLGRAPPQGAVLELTATLVAPRGPDGGFDERTWLRRHGVHVVVRGRDWRVVGHRGGLTGFADRVRGSIDTAIASGTTGERRAVLLGIVLGEDEGLTDSLRDHFRASGLYHLLAVSGSNVALVAGGVLLLAWLLGIPRLIGEVGALAAIGAYVMAVGAQPSVVRAGVAGALTSLAWICARERDRWWFLLVGALVLLVWSPYNLLDAGFQLSFAAVAAIFVLVPPLMRLLEGYPLPGVVAGVVAVSTACGAVTAPILLVQFGSVPTYSVFSNALAAPVVAPLLGLGLLSAVVYPLLPDVATLVASLDGWLAAYLSACARMVAGLPYARIGALPMLGVVGAVVFAWVGARSVRRRAEAGIALAVVALAGFAGWHMLPHASSPPPPNGLRITFLDVGQGDGALIQVPEGAVLVDEGPPEAHVAAQLRRHGVRSLSVVVLTHPERDHVGGAAEVLASTPAQVVLDPRIAATGPDERAAIVAARAQHDRIVMARPGVAFRIGRLRIRVLWPDGPGLPSDNPNDDATVLLVSYGQTDALFAADAESNVLLPLRLPSVEILKVSHHGSADAGLAELLEDLRPRIAVISVGADNTYGHPTAETLAALHASPGLAVYRTDEDGAVTVESDGRRITVATEH